MTNLYGLIGKKLSHSFSPDYFEKKFLKLGLAAEFRLFELEDITQFPELLRKTPELKGLSVTVPYKVEILPFLDELDNTARQIKSVNSIRIKTKNGKPFLKGFNTDVIGFEQSLVPLLGKRKVSKALILGTGGSAQSVAFVLKKLGIEFVFVSRKPVAPGQISYAEITGETLKEFQLIVQATPVGMFPHIAEAPAIPYQFLTGEHILFDLIYNPSETRFLKHGRLQGARVSNGLKMLGLQAEASWKIWHSEEAPFF